jgi:hypothetical protein
MPSASLREKRLVNMQTPIVRGFYFRCPVCAEPILLPRRSLLGTYEGLEYRHTDIWPISFLCTRSERLCVCSAEAIHPQIGPVMDPHRGQGVLWKIDCQCGHENCARRSTIYAIYSRDADAREIIDTVLHATATCTCDGDHPLDYAAETTTAVAVDP